MSRIRPSSLVRLAAALGALACARAQDPVEGPAGISGEPNAVVTGELGQSFVLRCLAYGHPEPSIYWYRGLSGPMVPFSSAQYEARGAVLRIRALAADTLGEYACQAYNGIGKAASWSVLLQAYTDGAPGPHLVPRAGAGVVVLTPRPPPSAPPATAAPPPEVPVYTVPVRTRLVAEATALAAGAELSLPCEVDGFPVPAVRWTKDGATLTSGDRIDVTEARLTISRVTEEDSGEYGCHASNPYSSHSSTVHITVQGLYIPAKCTDNPFFANCHLIVRSKFCQHKYYSKFCCKSCLLAGQLNPQDLENMQADESFERRK